MIRFHQQLSDDSVFARYLQLLPLKTRAAHERLQEICREDQPTQLVFACIHSALSGEEVVGILRLSRLPARSAAEVAVILRDDFQGQGLGRALLGEAINIARSEGIEELQAMMLGGNQRMRHIARKLGFNERRCPEDASISLFDLRLKGGR